MFLNACVRMYRPNWNYSMYAMCVNVSSMGHWFICWDSWKYMRNIWCNIHQKVVLFKGWELIISKRGICCMISNMCFWMLVWECIDPIEIVVCMSCVWMYQAWAIDFFVEIVGIIWEIYDCLFFLFLWY